MNEFSLFGFIGGWLAGVGFTTAYLYYRYRKLQKEIKRDFQDPPQHDSIYGGD